VQCGNCGFSAGWGIAVMNTGRANRSSEMMRAPKTLALYPGELRETELSVTRLISPTPLQGLTSAYEPEDAFMVTIQLSAFKFDIHRNGRRTGTCAFDEGTMAIYDMQHVWQSNMLSPFDGIHFHLPRLALIDLSRRLEMQAVSAISAPVADGKQDQTLYHLTQSLLPALENPRSASRLFVESVRLAIASHVISQYGGRAIREKSKPRLAQWQLSRATDFLLSHMADDISVEAVAKECGLSEAYFIKAFCHNTGQPPHRWLKHHRLARAKELLEIENLAISDIAVICGFFYQSHMTREFKRAYGLPPGQWQRQRSGR
jgi:AraC family transcriptional regulator